MTRATFQQHLRCRTKCGDCIQSARCRPRNPCTRASVCHADNAAAPFSFWKAFGTDFPSRRDVLMRLSETRVLFPARLHQRAMSQGEAAAGCRGSSAAAVHIRYSAVTLGSAAAVPMELSAVTAKRFVRKAPPPLDMRCRLTRLTRFSCSLAAHCRKAVRKISLCEDQMCECVVRV